MPTDGSEVQFQQWLLEQDVWGVLWFAEEWTQAPKAAPFLADGGRWCYEQLCLQEKYRGDEYGWIFFLLEQNK